jgi:hypothetical protein
MDFFYTTYPISALFVVGVLCLFILISFTNILLGTMIIFLAYMDCITLTPLFKCMDGVISILFKDTIQKIRANIRESFPVTYKEHTHKVAIYLFHPHGIFSLAHAFHVIGNMTDWPHKNIKAAVHYILTSMPLLKDFNNNRCVASEYGTMKAVLLDNKSLSVALGGRTEANYIHPNKMTIVVNKRRGVFKLALETGVPIIPVLSYGENKVYKKMDNIFIDAFSYVFKFSIPIPTLDSLKDWFKIYKSPLENKVETFIGDPIEVGQAHVPTDKEIIELREKYIEGLKELYKKTKPNDYEESIEIL